MDIQLLKDQNIAPSEEVLKITLGEYYNVYYELIQLITNQNFGLAIEWRYYKDGKAWLCKVSHKKKTIFWLSVWDKFFKIGFYFTEKNRPEINELNINSSLKDEFSTSKPIGKLLPLVINMNKNEQIDDAIKIIEYKKGLK